MKSWNWLVVIVMAVLLTGCFTTDNQMKVDDLVVLLEKIDLEKVYDAIPGEYKIGNSNIVDQPNQPPEPLPQYLLSVEQTEWSSIKWIRDNFKNAKVIDINMSVDSATRHNVVMRYDRLPRDKWPTKTVNGVVCNAITCVFWGDTPLTGGKYDWIRPNQRDRELKHVNGSYVPGVVMPAAGTPVAFAVVSTDGKYCGGLGWAVIQ